MMRFCQKKGRTAGVSEMLYEVAQHFRLLNLAVLESVQTASSEQ